MTNFVDVFGDYTVPPSEQAYSAITLTENSVLVWPELSALGADNQFFATAILEVTAPTGVTLNLPPVVQVSLGKDILLRNVGAETLQVNDSDGVSVTTIAAGTAKYVFTKDADSNTWGVLTYGAGASGAEATELAGAGLAPSSNQLQLFATYTQVNSDRVLDFTVDRFKTLDVVTAATTISLGDASLLTAQGFIVLVRNSSAGEVTIASTAGQTIDDAVNKVLAPRESCIVLQASSGWVTVGYGRDIEFVYSETVVDITAADVVLTSAQVAGRMLRITGAPTADRLVNLPAVSNVYYVTVEPSVSSFSVGFRIGVSSPVTLLANQSTALYTTNSQVFTAVNTAIASTAALADGSAAAPALNFLADDDTGLYRKNNNQLGVAAGGVESLVATATGVEIPGILDCGTLS